MKKIYYLLVFFAVSLSSCNLDHVEDSDYVCVKKWTVNKTNSKLSTDIINGSLKISANSFSTGNNVQFSQSYIKGDFNSSIKIDHFNTGLTSDSIKAYFDFYIIDSLGNKAITRINNKSICIYINDTLKSIKTFNNNAPTIGSTLKINRSGSSLTFEIIGNSTSPLDGSTIQTVLQFSYSNYSNSKSSIGFSLGAEENISKQIMLNVSEFDITNGGNEVKGDLFDCNSIKY